MAVILIPGIKGSELIDSYPPAWPRRWSAGDWAIDDPWGDPFDLTLVEGAHDADAGHWMQPSRPLYHAYGSILHKLRRWLQPEPVHAFSYDWRKPLELSAQRLVRMMDEVLERERLAGRKPVLQFVTHSMGGLLLRSALALRNRRDPFADIGRIVFIAPPFRGSIGTPWSLVIGDSDGWFGTDPDHRKVTRGFPAVYQMIPSWPGAVHDEDGHPLDLFNPESWQENVRQAATFRADFVRNAEAFVRGKRARHGGHSNAPMLTDQALAKAADRVLVLCGTGNPTPCSLPVLTRNQPNPNWFDFTHLGMDKLGDGRVCLASAAIRGVTLAAFANAGEHGMLCLDTRVTSLVSTWLQEGKAPMLTPRGPGDPLQRRRRMFKRWDGKISNFKQHIAS